MEATPQPIFTLEKYTENPLDIRFDINLSGSRALDICHKFMPRWHSLFFLQWHYIKKTVATLIDDGILRPFTVRLTPSLVPRAYMRDGGDMFFTLGALITRSSMVTLSVLCHELAHMWLSQRSYYADLKHLNKSFLARYATTPNNSLLSPIELYAMVISVEMMRAISLGLENQKYKRRFEAIIDRECEKIEMLTKEIIMLRR